MRVRTRYFAMLREVTGIREEEFNVPEDLTLIDFIKYIAERYERLKKILFDECGELRRGFAVAHNTVTVPRGEIRLRRIRDGDEVVILPPIGGGYLNDGSLTPR